jgi:hypothetical protein
MAEIPDQLRERAELHPLRQRPTPDCPLLHGFERFRDQRAAVVLTDLALFFGHGRIPRVDRLANLWRTDERKAG